VTDVFIAVSAVTAFMAIARISSKFFKGNEVALEDWILVTALVNLTLLPSHVPT
jgi:hypothetical protein